jgi:ubiquinone/menaquinone biosynthesis C-methylase UbiE
MVIGLGLIFAPGAPGRKALLLLALAAVPACAQSSGVSRRSGDAPAFPAADRPVAGIVSPSWDREEDRDRTGEAERVFELLRIGPGVRVADVGAGSGYYTLRLARRLGPAATVYAEDIQPAYLAELEGRLRRERVLGVTTVLGTPADPRLPPASVDVALLAHMYHEIESPYEFLYNLQPALAPGGRVAIVDLDRPTVSHGTPPALLRCELEAVGYRQIELQPLVPAQGYLAIFEVPDRRPEPATIRRCRQ